MKKLLLTGLCVAALAACESKEQPLAETALKCNGQDIGVKVYQDRIDATIDGKTITMPQVMAASGAKYQAESDGAILWNKGDNWIMMNSAEDIVIDCE
jgi:membrane-bound inhibitor of C-type lysozyme